MSRIILDFGSGNSCRNDIEIVKRMIDELKAVDTGKHEIIIKWQIFEKAGENIPILPDTFEFAYQYAERLGYKTTASVFDKNSLEFLLEYDIPFVKIANRRDLDWLVGEVSRKIPVYISSDIPQIFGEVGHMIRVFSCVSKYPAEISDYDKQLRFLIANCPDEKLRLAISDHTIGLELFKKYQPQIWEKHYKLPESTGLDAGDFAITAEELREIL